jgi:hypothetical protein
MKNSNNHQKRRIHNNNNLTHLILKKNRATSLKRKQLIKLFQSILKYLQKLLNKPKINNNLNRYFHLVF